MKNTLFIFCLLLASSGIWAQENSQDLNNSTPSTDIVLNFERSDCEQGENSIHKIQLAPNITINDTLNVCENKWTTFYINGGNLKNIIKISWEVTGGELKNNNEIVASILWGELGFASVKVKIVLDNLTNFENTFQLRKNSKDGYEIQAPNSIKFDYDTSGNQRRRSMIFLTRVSNPNTDDSSKETPKYSETDDYEDVLYFPNPVKQELNVKWIEKAGQDMQRMELYDLNGRLMHTFPNQSTVDTAVINFDNYPSGIYSLVLVYAGGENKTLKIVKK